MMVQFVAFLGAYRDPGSLDPWVAAELASLLVTWVTFVPSFLFVLLDAPYMERLRGNRSLSAALTGITAAVVGVIANLGVHFAPHTLFSDTVDVDGGPLSLDLPDGSSGRCCALSACAPFSGSPPGWRGYQGSDGIRPVRSGPAGADSARRNSTTTPR